MWLCGLGWLKFNCVVLKCNKSDRMNGLTSGEQNPEYGGSAGEPFYLLMGNDFWFVLCPVA